MKLKKIIFLKSEFRIHTMSYYLDDPIFVVIWSHTLWFWVYFSCGFIQCTAKPICIWIISSTRIHQFKSFVIKRKTKRKGKKIESTERGTPLLVTKHNCIMSNVELNWVENAHKKCCYGSSKSISQYRLAVQLNWSLLLYKSKLDLVHHSPSARQNENTFLAPAVM